MIEPDPKTRKKFIEEYTEKRNNGTITPTESDALESLIKEEEEWNSNPANSKSSEETEEKTEEKTSNEGTTEDAEKQTTEDVKVAKASEEGHGGTTSNPQNISPKRK